MPTIVVFFNIYEYDEFHECFKIDIVTYAINNISRLKNILQILTKIQIIYLHKSTVFVMLMDVKTPTFIGYFNIYEHCKFHANVC